jgi:hypothetical protein
MEDYFLVPKEKIESHYKTENLYFEFYALEYCEEVLEIPLINIEESYYQNGGLLVSLKNLENHHLEEDWYIQLGRMSKYARAS